MCRLGWHVLVPVLITALTVPGTAQWSTTHNVDSSLFVCNGFYPAVVSLDDGNSIILGALSYSIYAQKLDEFGYKQWTPGGNVVHYHEGSDIGAGLLPNEPWGGWVSDGSGGVVFFWYDQRSASRVQGNITSNSIYAQHVDRYGSARWGDGGLLIAGPETGVKRNGGIVDDGQGGCIIAWVDDSFDLPDSANLTRITAQRVSVTGSKQWEIHIDSATTRGTFAFKNLIRVKDRVILQFYGSPPCVLDTLGNRQLIDSSLVFGAMTASDSTTYHAVTVGTVKTDGDTIWTQVRLSRLSERFDTLYTQVVEERTYGEFFSNPTPVIADGHGGLYSITAFATSAGGVPYGHMSIQHTNGISTWPTPLLLHGSDRPYAVRSTGGNLTLFNAMNWGYVQSYDTSGSAQWPEPVRMVGSILDVDNVVISGDGRGGLIMAFWTPSGSGIHCQHSGRQGRLGLVTSMGYESELPDAFVLNQNYPNPFNSVTTISFSTTHRSRVSLRVYDLMGREVASLADESLAAGEHKVRLDAGGLCSGVYFCHLTVDGHLAVRRMLLLR